MSLTLLRQQLAISSATDTVSARVATNAALSIPAPDLAQALGVVVKPPTYLYVNAEDGLRLRSTPNGTIIGAIGYGEKVQLLSEVFPVVNALEWANIKTSAGVTAFSARKYLQVNPPDAVPAPPPGDKIGLHLMGTLTQDMITRAIAKRATVYKSIENPSALVQIRQAIPGATFVYRRYQDSNQDPSEYIAQSGGLDAAVNRWMADMEGLFQQIPWAAFESFNEPGNAEQAYCDFEELRVQRMAARGLKAVILNVGAGKSDKAMWGRAAKAVRAAIVANGYVGIHGYAQSLISAAYNGSHWENGQWVGPVYPPMLKLDDPNPNAWHAFRVERDIADLKALQITQAKFILTEFGLDDMIDPNGYPSEGRRRGWKTNEDVWRNRGWLNGKTATQFYREQLVYANTVLGRLPQVVGATVFSYGDSLDPQWDQFEVQEVV